MLFLITGPDTYRARAKLNELKAKFCRDIDPTSLNLLTVQADKLDAASLRHYFATVPLLVRRRFVVLEDFFLNPSADVFKAAATMLPEESAESNVVVFFEATPPQTSHSFYRWLLARAHHQQFPALAGLALRRWATEAFRERQRTVEPRALDRLLGITGSDLWRLSQEIRKLDAYLEAGEIVGEAAVEMLVAEPVAQDIFALTDGMAAGETARSAPLLIEHLEQNISPQQLVALLERQFRFLLLLAEHRGQNAPRLPAVPSYVVKKLWPLARRTDIKRLKRLYVDLAQLDLDLKTSAGDEKTLWLAFLTKFSGRATTS